LPLIHRDRVELQQVVLNLIVNAVEAMSRQRRGMRELWISTETDARTSLVRGIRQGLGGFAHNHPSTLARARLRCAARGRKEAHRERESR